MAQCTLVPLLVTSLCIPWFAVVHLFNFQCSEVIVPKLLPSSALGSPWVRAAFHLV